MPKPLHFDVQHTNPLLVKRALALVYPDADKWVRKVAARGEGEVFFFRSQNPANTVKLTDKSISQYKQLIDGKVPAGTQGKWKAIRKIKNSMHKVRKAKRKTRVARDPANPECYECVICPVFAKTGGCKHTLVMTINNM